MIGSEARIGSLTMAPVSACTALPPPAMKVAAALAWAAALASTRAAPATGSMLAGAPSVM